jgi:drug/metabolite transporter (DMT)-like permease
VPTLFLYSLTVLIWGSTWLAITFQLGAVDPVVSILYRFGLASLILFVVCGIARRPLRFSLRQHGWMALQGFFLFSISYWMVYLAETVIASGLVAVVTSALIFMNIFFGALFLKSRISPQVVFGASLGILGILLIFWPEITAVSLRNQGTYGLLLSILSTVIYSLGNITSARNQKHGLPVIQSNAWSMGYAALIMFLIAIVTGKSFGFELSLRYVASLGYLAVFGSVIAFSAYLTLIGRIGADRAAYGPLVVPVIALTLSKFFEGYAWSVFSIVGIALILAGNFMVLRFKKKLEK